MGAGFEGFLIDSRVVDRFLNGTERLIQRIAIPLPGSRRLRYGIERGGIYRPVRRTAGFFSQCTTILADLASLPTPARKIVARGALEAYRVLPGANSWNKFFSKPSRSDPMTERSGEVADMVTPAVQYSQYRALDFDFFSPLVEQYFQPSAEVVNRMRDFVTRYRIVPNELIAVNIRGTDKWKEVSAPRLQNFVKWGKEALRKHPNAKLLLVTDDSRLAEQFETAFVERVLRISELPMSSRTNSPIHRGLARSKREKFAVDFLAAVHIMSSAKILITHTGNVAFWTVLFRGHSKGLVQIHGNNSFGSLTPGHTDGESQDCTRDGSAENRGLH